MKDFFFLLTLWLAYVFDLPFKDEDSAEISEWQFWTLLSLSDAYSNSPWDYEWEFINGEWRSFWKIPF